MCSDSGAGASTFLGAPDMQLPLCLSVCLSTVTTTLLINSFVLSNVSFLNPPPHPKLNLDSTGPELEPLAQVHIASEWLSIQMQVTEVQASRPSALPIIPLGGDAANNFSGKMPRDTRATAS